MQWDAIVLAGGRASRLGGVDKMLLAIDDRTLLGHAFAAVSGAERTVAVGPEREAAPAEPGVVWVRENPPFGGPAAAVAAGLEALAQSGTSAPFTVVIASDLPAADVALPRLLAVSAAALGEDVDGWTAADPDGRRQPLLAVYRTASLRRAVEVQSSTGSVDGLSMRRLLDTLALQDIPLDAALTADVDTPEQWEAVRRAAAPMKGTDHAAF